MKTSLGHWHLPGSRVGEPALKAGRAEGAGSRLKSMVRSGWRMVMNRIAPVGYQDEHGFHYGDQPVPRGPSDKRIK